MKQLVSKSRRLLSFELGEFGLQLGDFRLDASRLARIVRLSLGPRELLLENRKLLLNDLGPFLSLFIHNAARRMLKTIAVNGACASKRR